MLFDNLKYPFLTYMCEDSRSLKARKFGYSKEKFIGRK